MSGREDTTRSLSEMVLAKIRRHPYWACEVPIDSVDGRSRRVDFMDFRPFVSFDFSISSAIIEKGVFNCYEVKSCMEDFRSGHGLNFVGDNNYLVCERDLADALYERGELPRHCIVLCPNKPRTALIEKYRTANAHTVRKMSASELLFAMMVGDFRKESGRF